MARFDYFVILGEMRTGSNLLQEHLNTFEGISCHGELFNPVFINAPRNTTYLGFTFERRMVEPFALLDALRAQPGLNGFRLFYDHDARIRAHVLADPACAKIVLNRNPLQSYVSRKIAAATDQWKLMNVARRRQARVTFDAGEFERYLHRLQATQREIQRALQTGGQSGFYIHYDDLNDVSVLNGLAAWLGVQAQIETPSQRLKKQNPEPLEEKLLNPQDLAPGLARIDRFDLGRTPDFAPRMRPQPGAAIAGARTPLLFMPMRGAPEGAVAHWLAALDGVGRDALQTGFNHERLARWKGANPGWRSFTVLRHPLRRAHAAFLSRVLDGGARPVRRHLEAHFDVSLPEPGARPEPAEHRALFLAFLRFAGASLAGQTAMQPWPIWTSQAALIEAMAETGGPDHILREETLAQELTALAALYGHQQPPPLAPAPEDEMLLAICDVEIEQAAQAAWRRDYARFGFGTLR
ncbi:MAG: nodulation protein NodH [Pararhodobacter sp.]|nr:nodulation protein NodH [Pararhodobacter sp.]